MSRAANSLLLDIQNTFHEVGRVSHEPHVPTMSSKITKNKSLLRACQERARLALILVVMSLYVARESDVTLALHISTPLRRSSLNIIKNENRSKASRAV